MAFLYFFSLQVCNVIFLRIKYNSKLNKLIKNINTINHIKSIILGDLIILVKEICKWKPIMSTSRGKGTPKSRWKDDVLVD